MSTRYRNPRPQPARLARPKASLPVNHDLEVVKLETVEMYSAIVAAWFTTAMEFDRALITLGAAALGLLIGLATTGVTELSALQANVYSGALISFCASLAFMLVVFKLNKGYLEEMVEKRAEARISHPVLKALDWAGMVSFGIGALLTMYVAISAVQKKSFTSDKVSMSDKSKVTPNVPALDSVNGAMQMSTFGKSFNGAMAMAPKVPVSAASTPISAPVEPAQTKTSQL
jgi:hypothetical protein